jgi:tripartite ATP-independent transporter DctM subunit
MLSTSLLLLIALLAIGLPVAGVLGILGFALDSGYSAMPLTRALGEVAWSSSNGFLLMSIPLFILLGEILLRSGIADRMYDAMSTWLAWLPGGLMHSNIGSCALFAATCGSSAATAATVATVALPQMKKYGYNEKLFLGSLASGGTLGILIPPSINMIIYGALTDTSVPKLYLAGIVPGVLLALLFMAAIFVICLIQPSYGGIRLHPNWSERIATLKDFAPPLAIFLVVILSIYTGAATATESAALGVLAALALAALYKRVNLRFFARVFEGTMKTTAMILLIIMAAVFLNFIMGGIGLTGKINAYVTSLHLSKYELLLAIVIFYVILGCFMETLSIMVTTLPVITPLMVHAGFDPVWFGIIVIILIEMALITPPVGVNLYVIQGVRDGGKVSDVIIGSLPFVAMMFLLIGLLTLFPSLALYLPSMGKP